jgi:CBS domain-containing protein
MVGYDALRGEMVSDVAGVMRKNKIDPLPVVTSSQKLIGY